MNSTMTRCRSVFGTVVQQRLDPPDDALPVTAPQQRR